LDVPTRCRAEISLESPHIKAIILAVGHMQFCKGTAYVVSPYVKVIFGCCATSRNDLHALQ
jgi:hypothetical protein